jgi:diguanylate cyclase (GGDEF)-like protein
MDWWVGTAAIISSRARPVKEKLARQAVWAWPYDFSALAGNGLFNSEQKRGYNSPKLRFSMPQALGAERKQPLQELAIFHDVAKALTSSLNLNSVLQTIMEKVAEYFRPDTWSLLMIDENKGELYFAIAVGDAVEMLKTVRLKIGEGIAGWVAKHGEPMLVPDVYNDPRFSRKVDELTRCQTRSIICLPLKSRHRVLGVMQLINVGPELFGDQEIFFLQSLCDYAAIAIDNARSVERIQELTVTDDCTGLFNARHLYKTLESEVYRSARFGYEFSVIFLDLDHFKAVNDTHGHLIGSKLLREVGQIIKGHLRLIDYAFRYGGDEFVILLPQTSKDQATIACRRLLDLLRAGVFLKDEELDLKVSASFGVATYPGDAKSAHDLIRQADEMMYLVKNSTRDSIAVAQHGVLATQ